MVAKNSSRSALEPEPRQQAVCAAEGGAGEVTHNLEQPIDCELVPEAGRWVI